MRLRLTGIEEEEMQAGFVICSRHVPVPCVTYFQAQLQVICITSSQANSALYRAEAIEANSDDQEARSALHYWAVAFPDLTDYD